MPAEPLGPWMEFGLPGLVIGALFFLLWWTINTTSKTHKEERTEWRADANIRQEKTDVVIKELTDVIRDRVK